MKWELRLLRTFQRSSYQRKTDNRKTDNCSFPNICDPHLHLLLNFFMPSRSIDFRVIRMPPARGASKYQEGEPVLCFQVFLSWVLSSWTNIDQKFSYHALFRVDWYTRQKCKLCKKRRAPFSIAFIIRWLFTGFTICWTISLKWLIRAGTRHRMNVCPRTGY